MMFALGPTIAQAAVLSFITERLRTDGVSPTFEEIKTHCGLASKAAVSRLIDGLIERGQLVKAADRWRGLSLPSVCPCCGRPR